MPTFSRFSLSLAILFFVPSAVIADDDYPARKAGLWEITTSSTSLHGGQPMIMSQCIDATTDRQMFDMGRTMAGSSCTTNELKKEGANWIINSACKFGPTSITSSGTYGGDFSATYHAEINAHYTPAFMGHTESKTVLDGVYKGACLPGQTPGDMIMANGMKMNILTMMQHGLGNAKK
jgi:hypothetical protein